MKHTLKATAAIIGIVAAVVILGMITNQTIKAAENIILLTIN